MSRPFQHFRRRPQAAPVWATLLRTCSKYSLCVLMSNCRDPSPTELMACHLQLSQSQSENSSCEQTII